MRIGAVDTQMRSYVPTAAAEQTAPATGFFDEPAAILDLTAQEEAKNPWDLNQKQYEAAKAEKTAQPTGNGPADHSGRLTRRLVAARYQGEVYSIISEAYKNLSEWLQAAAGGDSNAMAAIKRLNRLIRRSSRKIGDLNKEDTLRDKQKRAEKAELELRAREIKAELRRIMAERKRREQTYLRDAQRTDDNGPTFPKPLSPAALEAKMLALATAMGQMSAGTTAAAAEPAVTADAGGGEAAAAEADAPAAE
ncbi:MAG: hypothetical protein LBI19_00890 [Oscillospiraceae bacterium]|nr:hypothetical protein [Oscillospiraceae bacterium]